MLRPAEDRLDGRAVRPGPGHAIWKLRYRVTDLSENDPSLVDRDNLMIWFDDARTKDNRKPEPPVRLGKPSL